MNVLVVGDAVIVGRPNEAGEDTDVPERVRGLLLAQTTFRAAVRKKGSQNWLDNQLKFPDYWGAVTWTMLLRDNWTRLKEIHVLPASEVEEPPGHPGGDNYQGGDRPDCRTHEFSSGLVAAYSIEGATWLLGRHVRAPRSGSGSRKVLFMV